MIHAYIGKPGILRRLFATTTLQIDIGIALYHLKIASEYFGKKATISYSPTTQTAPSKGYTYIATLNIS
jgi:hypothetical protein